jgi:hypothetical protein
MYRVVTQKKRRKDIWNGHIVIEDDRALINPIKEA